MTTNFSWAEDVLLGADPPFPVSTINVSNVARWMAAEEPPSSWFHNNDPLNTNNISAGDTESFPNLTSAAIATGKVIRQPNMIAIASVLDQRGTLEEFSAGCAEAPWSTGGYHGIPGYIASVPLPAVVTAPGTLPVVPVKVMPPAKGTPTAAQLKVAKLVRVHELGQKQAVDNGWHLWYFSIDHFVVKVGDSGNAVLYANVRFREKA
jgi:hypothetical protein